MIKPTIGRVVWYHPHPSHGMAQSDQPLAAIVCYVHHDRLVNLAVFDQGGAIHARQSVVLAQDDDQIVAGGCQWMPYQVGQAKKHEADDNADKPTIEQQLAPIYGQLRMVEEKVAYPLMQASSHLGGNPISQLSPGSLTLHTDEMEHVVEEPDVDHETQESGEKTESSDSEATSG